jgi:hypothetical protein
MPRRHLVCRLSVEIKTLGSLTLFDTCCYITRSFVLSYSFQTDHRRHLAIEQLRQLSLHF